MSDLVGRIRGLDPETRGRVERGCQFINAEIARHRGSIITTTIVLGILSLPMSILFQNPFPTFVALFVTFLVTAVKSFMELRSGFKTVVVRRIVDALGAGLSYSPKASLTQEQVERLGLLGTTLSHFSAEDEVRSSKGGIPFTIAECTTGSLAQARVGEFKQTQFHGLLLRLDFNKRFTGRVVVVTNADSQIIGGLLGEFSQRDGMHLARMENPDFESRFSVYATDDQQARYILSPRLMELMVEAQAGFRGGLRFGFFDDTVGMAVPGHNYFEVFPFSPKVTPESVAGDLVAVLQIANGLIDALSLETRIWSRA